MRLILRRNIPGLAKRQSWHEEGSAAPYTPVKQAFSGWRTADLDTDFFRCWRAAGPTS